MIALKWDAIPSSERNILYIILQVEYGWCTTDTTCTLNSLVMRERLATLKWDVLSNPASENNPLHCK